MTSLTLDNLAGGEPCTARSIYLDDILLTNSNTGSTYNIGDVSNGSHNITVSGNCSGYICEPLNIPFTGTAPIDSVTVDNFNCVVTSEHGADVYYYGFDVSALKEDLGGQIPTDFNWALLSNGTEISSGTIINSSNPNNITVRDFTGSITDMSIQIETIPNGCISEQNVIVGCVSGTSITYTAITTDASCGLDNGIITLSDLNGNNSTDGEYYIYIRDYGSTNYTLLGITTSTTYTINNLSVGSYDIKVSDGTVFTENGNITISETETAISATTSVAYYSCGKGNVTFNISGGAPCTTYDIYELNSSNSYLGKTSPFTVSGVTNGTYTYEIEAACQGNSCSSFTVSTTVAEPQDIISTDNVNYDDRGSLTMDVTCKTDVNTPRDFTVYVYDSSGTELTNQHYNNTNGTVYVSLSFLTNDTNGTYTIVADVSQCEITEVWVENSSTNTSTN